MPLSEVPNRAPPDLLTNGRNWEWLKQLRLADGDLDLSSGHLLVGNASGVATDTAVTGDVTISNTGVTAIGANKVGASQITTLPGCRVFNSANIAVNNTTDTYLTFDSERFDTDTMHSTVTNTGRITFTTAGVYTVTGNVRFASTGGGLRESWIRLNGTTRIAHDDRLAVTGGDNTCCVTTIYKFAAADYVELGCYQDSGLARNVVASGNYSPEFSAAWMSD